MPNLDTVLLKKTDANQKMTFEFFTTNSTVLDESKSSLLLFDIVSTTFVPGKISLELSKLRSIAELRAFYGMLIFCKMTMILSSALSGMEVCIKIYCHLNCPAPQTDLHCKFFIPSDKMREVCQRKTAVMLVNFTYFPTPLLHMQFNFSVLLYPLVCMQIYCNKYLYL
jgi:hypothetical protein